MEGWHGIEMRCTAVDAGTFTASYSAQWDNMRLIERPKIVPATIAFDPNTLHLHSPGKWLVCYIEFPAGYDVNNIDEATVTLQNIPAYLGKDGWGKLACHKSEVPDRDGDGIPERIFRFDLDAVQVIVQPPEATLTVKGSLADETPFEGSATIKVVDKLAELRARLQELKAKVQDIKDKRNDEKNGCAGIKDLRDKIQDVVDKCKDKDDKGRDKDDKGARKK